jgi:chaperonin GroEL (HSP60 family)
MFKKTVREEGDGNTTATVLAHAILKNAYAIENPNARKIKEGINKAVEKVIKYLE